MLLPDWEWKTESDKEQRDAGEQEDPSPQVMHLLGASSKKLGFLQRARDAASALRFDTCGTLLVK